VTIVVLLRNLLRIVQNKQALLEKNTDDGQHSLAKKQQLANGTDQ
jgi:hypothetical protein